MSLVVSLRIPDGVVIGADSLSTAPGALEITGEITATCPECREEIRLSDLQLPPVPLPMSSFSFAQKLFPLYGRFGIATYGLNIVAGRTVHHHLKHMQTEENVPESIEALANRIRDYFQALVAEEIPNLEEAPEEFKPLGFHIAGCENEVPHTAVVETGREPSVSVINEIGCTASGANALVQCLWSFGERGPQFRFDFQSFALQDAIDHVKFLIQLTTDYQRFTRSFQTVGGQADIALITPHTNFIWIQGKALTRKLEEEEAYDED